MNIVVTGGAGYIGSHIVEALNRSTHAPVALDNLITGARASVPREQLHIGDIADSDAFSVLVRRGVGAVVHCAASADVPDSVKDPARYFENNVAKGLYLLESMRTHGVHRIVLSSSAAVYGAPSMVPVGEDCARRPHNPYGLSKLIFEQLLEWYEKAYGFRYVVLRYFCVAGAVRDASIGEDHRPEKHLTPSALLVALGKRELLKVNGTAYPTPDGTAIRDFVHVMDVARANVLAIEHLASGGKSLVLNVGLGTGHSVLEVVRSAERISGQAIPLESADPRAGDVPVLVADTARLRSTLNWVPEFDSLDAIVESAWEWHKNHPGGFESEES